MEGTGSLDHRIVKAFEAILLERRARLQESVRARVAEHRTGERRRSPEDATNAVESLSEDLEVAMLDRESREAAQHGIFLAARDSLPADHADVFEFAYY